MAEDQHVYDLYCPVPGCGDTLQGLWFVNSNATDDHGYICCSKCVSSVARKVGKPKSAWHRFIRSKMRKYPRDAWIVSYNRTVGLYDPPPAAAAAAAPVADGAATDEDDEQSGTDDGEDDAAAAADTRINDFVASLQQHMRAAAVKAGVAMETCDMLFNNMSQDVLLNGAADADAGADEDAEDAQVV